VPFEKIMKQIGKTEKGKIKEQKKGLKAAGQHSDPEAEMAHGPPPDEF
jgi:hypothetical protein